MCEKRDIQIRSLCGQCTTILIDHDKTIRELKLLLKQTFPPAFSSPRFHLFVNGVKLDLRCTVGRSCIEPGSVVILVPFAKNDFHSHNPKPENSLAPPCEATSSSFADSSWSEIMEDLISMQKISPCTGNKVDAEAASPINSRVFVDSSKPKRQKCFYGNDRVRIVGLLQSMGDSVLDEQISRRLIEVLQTFGCLSDSLSGNCMLKETFSYSTNNFTNRDGFGLCICPSWLKAVLKTFAFVNILYTVSQLQEKSVTRTCLAQTMSHIRKCGLEITFSDLDKICLLCPKVVFLIGDEVHMCNYPMQEKASVQTNYAYEKQCQMAFAKRERSFRSNLWKAIKMLMHKKGNVSGTCFSIDDILECAKDTGGSGGDRERISPAKSSSQWNRKKCLETNTLHPIEMLEHLKNVIGSLGQIVHVEDIDARVAAYCEIPENLSEDTKLALSRLGIKRLYSHQADSIRASLVGNDVIVATMTSSGKSLCYNVPILEMLSSDASSCAMYVFPTKALAHDQLRALLAMTEGTIHSTCIGVYDGDTSPEERVLLRDNARVLITNPDMLHMSVLPFHGQFQRFLSNLRFMVIDEAHAYKGAFGCHTALILRRLTRLCVHVHGCNPSFIFSTATATNPREHAMELANLSTIELIRNDGSPSAPKSFVLWNPPLHLKNVSDKTRKSSNPAFTGKMVAFRRASPIVEVSSLFAEMIQHGLRCITFCKSRKLCELVLCYTHEILQETAPHMVDSVCAYRAGYIAQDRRRIEKEFFGGKLLGIAATNALELGIDVGHIDVTLHLGFPGSIASLWQQAGRSGRRERPSLAIYVAFESPLDQYYMKHPQKLFGCPVECCHIDAKNPQLVEQHLICAALEHPLCLLHDEKFFGAGLEHGIISLRNRGYLSPNQESDSLHATWKYIGHEKMPARSISIRVIETERYKVINENNIEVLEEIEESRAFFQVYDGAVYIHQGKTYLVKDLNTSNKIALCQEADLKYYTKTRDYTDVHVLGGTVAYPASMMKLKTTAQENTCKVTTTWFGFRRIWKGSNQVFDTVELSLPTYSYESQAVWIRVHQSTKSDVEARQLPFRAGLHAAAHALLNLVPLYVMCNSSDLSTECVNPHDTRYVPERILLYEQHPGGIGLTAQILPRFIELLTAAVHHLTSCYCSSDLGCPNCIQSLCCHEYNEVLNKDAAVAVIQGVLHAEKLHF